MMFSMFVGFVMMFGVVVVVWKKLDVRVMVFLFGVVIGVMMLLLFVELYVKNVIEYGFWSVIVVMLGGVGTYACAASLLSNLETYYEANAGILLNE